MYKKDLALLYMLRYSVFRNEDTKMKKTWVVEVDGDAKIITDNEAQARFWLREYTENRGQKAVLKDSKGRVVA